MRGLWDYDIEQVKQTEQGKILLLERQINFGPDKDQKINLSDVKKYWDKLHLFPKRKKLIELYL